MSQHDYKKNVTTQDFVPTDEWPDVSTMLEGFGDPSLPDSAALVDQTLELVSKSGEASAYRFEEQNVVRVKALGASEFGEQSYYRAVEVRPGIFFIDILLGEGTKTVNSSLVLNQADGNVTHARSSFYSKAGQLRTTTTITAERVAGHGAPAPRARTSELVGKRILYRYSPTEAYEHVYFNAGTVAWQCVEGGEKGLADVEKMAQYELADDIYIYHWTETVMPVESFLVIDLAERRSIGRMFCWEETTLDPIHLPFDSRLTVLNETVYPAS